MDAILTRKCAFCGKDIVITKNNMRMISYKNKSYHTECFKTMCNGRVLKNNRYSPMYSEALQNLKQLETETKKKLMNRFVQDELNEYLIVHYDVGALSRRFWSIIADIQSGKYNGRRCKPIELETLFDMWKYYKEELDRINLRNLKQGDNIFDENRVLYDLAIIMKNYGKIQREMKKEKVAAEETKMATKTIKEKINYMSIGGKNTEDGQKDISSIMDEIF